MAVTNAWLSPGTSAHTTLGLVGAYDGGNAVLVVVDDADCTWEVPVTLNGTLLGVGVEVGFALSGGAELTLPDDPLVASQLVGEYDGAFFVAEAGVGSTVVDVQNDAGVRIEVEEFSAGVGVALGAALLTLDPEGEPVAR
jgi:hypothetical protein